MSGMFTNAQAFNQDINTNGDRWNTKNVTNMAQVFQGALKFNGDISNWNTAKVTTIQCIRNKNTFKKHPKPLTKRDAFYSRNEDRSLHPKSTGRKHRFH